MNGEILGCMKVDELGFADDSYEAVHPFLKLFPKSQIKEVVRSRIKAMGFEISAHIEEQLSVGAEMFGTKEEEMFVLWMVDKITSSS